MKSVTDSFNIISKGQSLIEVRNHDLKENDSTYSGPIDFIEMFEVASNLEAEIHIKEDPLGSVVHIPISILFEAGRVDLKPQGFPILKTLVKVIAANDYPLNILGHTDNLKTFDENEFFQRKLSSFRALNVLRYFISQNIDAKRITAFGWGPHQPLVSNSTPKSRAMNRRIDIVFLHKQNIKTPSQGVMFKEFFFRID